MNTLQINGLNFHETIKSIAAYTEQIVENGDLRKLEHHFKSGASDLSYTIGSDYKISIQKRETLKERCLAEMSLLPRRLIFVWKQRNIIYMDMETGQLSFNKNELQSETNSDGSVTYFLQGTTIETSSLVVTLSRHFHAGVPLFNEGVL